jgi:hypothetical protein
VAWLGIPKTLETQYFIRCIICWIVTRFSGPFHELPSPWVRLLCNISARYMNSAPFNDFTASRTVEIIVKKVCEEKSLLPPPPHASVSIRIPVLLIVPIFMPVVGAVVVKEVMLTLSSILNSLLLFSSLPLSTSDNLRVHTQPRLFQYHGSNGSNDDVLYENTARRRH